MSNISVVMRCRNEEQWIGHSIQSVVDFFDNPEIIIVDDNSTDNSRRVITTFDYLDIKIVNIDYYTPGKALNIGVKECSNDIVLVMSSHCVLTNVDVKKIKGLMKENVAVWGKQIPIMYGKKIGRRYMWCNFKDKPQINNFCKAEKRYFFHNAFSFFKTDFVYCHC